MLKRRNHNTVDSSLESHGPQKRCAGTRRLSFTSPSCKLPPVNNLLSSWTEKKRLALAAAGGLLLAAAFPNLSVAGLAWVAPGLVLLAALGARSPFKVGYMGGLLFHLAALHWLLLIPVKFYPILGWVALCGFLGLYWGVWCWAACALFSGSESWWRGQVWALLCATTWAGMEMVQARLFSGFPWNLLGVSQFRMVPLIQITSFTGVYGVSFIIVWFSASLLVTALALARDPSRRHLWMRHIVLPMLTVALLYAAGLRRITHPAPAGRNLEVALVQPSIPQTLIWDNNAGSERFDGVLRLSQAALAAKPQLLIWPEAVVPSLPRWDTNLWSIITNHVVAGSAWLIMGADDAIPRSPKEEDYFNSSFLVSPQGEMAGVYRKRRLVIFGEYIPLVRWLPFLKWLTPISGGFTPGTGPVNFGMPALGVRTSPLICFEDTFPHYVREHVTPETDFLVNLTNDGWFREGAAQWQHAANSVFRAVENGLPLVRCANNGLTCWIDAHGNIRDVLSVGTSIHARGFQSARIPLLPSGSQREPTFYTRHGDSFGWACVVVTAGILVWVRLRARGRR